MTSSALGKSSSEESPCRRTAPPPVVVDMPTADLVRPADSSGRVNQAIWDVFDELGGVCGFLEWVREDTQNRTIFYSKIFAGSMKSEKTMDRGGAIASSIVVRFV